MQQFADDDMRQVERLQAQTLGLMTALNEHQESAAQRSDDDSKVSLLEKQLAEKAEELDLANTQLESMKSMMRGGSEQEAATLREMLADRSEQLDLANAQLEVMKDMMRGGGPEEVASLKKQLDDKSDQLELANSQLEVM
jgi:chromosome segregation ATPase